MILTNLRGTNIVSPFSLLLFIEYIRKEFSYRKGNQ